MADILIRHGPEYLKKHDKKILPSHLHVIRDIISCRTNTLGGKTWFCSDCEKTVYSYHSCRNRHCPQCQNDKTDAWLGHQRDLLLPVTYFMITVTLPEEVRPVARSNQKKVYHLFFKSSAEAIQELALDKRFVGGSIGMMGVLQTWARDLNYHLHIHYIVPGIGLSKDGKKFKKAKKGFLIHGTPLAKKFKGKFKDALKKAGLLDQIPKAAWMKKWVADVELEKIKERLGKILSPVKKFYQKASKPFCCPTCGKAMAFIGELPRKRGPPEWMMNLKLQGTS